MSAFAARRQGSTFLNLEVSTIASFSYLDCQVDTHPHLRASMSFPGVSRHFRICEDCIRTTPNASSSSLPWSCAKLGDNAMTTAGLSGPYPLKAVDSPATCLRALICLPTSSAGRVAAACSRLLDDVACADDQLRHWRYLSGEMTS